MWDQVIDRKMLLSTAAQIVREARKLTVSAKISLEDAIQESLAVYESKPYIIYVGGIPLHKGKPKRKPTIPAAVIKKPRSTVKTDDGILLARIRGEIAAYLEKRITGVEPILREKLVSEFEVAVKVLIEELRHKMARLIEFSDDTKKVNQSIMHRDVVAACETLHMDPPTTGRPADLSKAKRQKKALAREYHPDVHGGDMRERMQEKFHAVLAAFSVIERYNEQVSPTGKGASSGDRTENGGVRG